MANLTPPSGVNRGPGLLPSDRPFSSSPNPFLDVLLSAIRIDLFSAMTIYPSPSLGIRLEFLRYRLAIDMDEPASENAFDDLELHSAASNS